MANDLNGVKDVAYRLDADSIDFMVRHYINDDDLIAECSNLIKDNYFSEDEKHYMIVVRYIRIYKKEFGDKPDLQSLRLLINDNDLIRNGYMMGGQTSLKEACYSIINSIGSFSDGEIEKNRNTCREILKRFLSERGFHDQLFKAVSTVNSNQSVIKDPTKFVEDISNVLSEIQSVQSSAVFNVIPDNWKPSIIIGESLGIPFLDQFMTGGVGAGDVYAVLGSFGSGKTWIGINVVTSFCSNENARKMKCMNEGKPYSPKIAILTHYEDSLDSMRFRLIASLAQIPMKHVVSHFTNNEPLSTRTTYREYEIKRYASVVDDALKKPECERFEEAKTILSSHCRIISLNGENPNHKGKGYVEELVGQINSCVKSSKAELGVLVLDYAKLMAERYISIKGNYEHLRHMIKNIPEKVALEVCRKYKCHAFILQQLSGATTNTRPGKPIHHSDASECKDFAENCHRVFCLGNKHEHSGVQRFDASKLRNDEFRSTKHAVIRFNGDTCNYELNNEWVIDEHSGFVPAGIVGGGMDVAPTRRSSRGSLSSDDDGF